jgi:hypothetical protein
MTSAANISTALKDVHTTNYGILNEGKGSAKLTQIFLPKESFISAKYKVNCIAPSLSVSTPWTNSLPHQLRKSFQNCIEPTPSVSIPWTNCLPHLSKA